MTRRLSPLHAPSAPRHSLNIYHSSQLWKTKRMHPVLNHYTRQGGGRISSGCFMPISSANCTALCWLFHAYQLCELYRTMLKYDHPLAMESGNNASFALSECTARRKTPSVPTSPHVFHSTSTTTTHLRKDKGIIGLSGSARQGGGRTSSTSSMPISFSAFSPTSLLQELLCAQYVHVSGQPPVFMLSSVHRCTCAGAVQAFKPWQHLKPSAAQRQQSRAASSPVRAR